MNRRGFLAALTAAFAAETLDVDKLLWVPGKKVISIPAPPKVVIAKGWYPVGSVKKLSPYLRFTQMRAVADPRVTDSELREYIRTTWLTH